MNTLTNKQEILLKKIDSAKKRNHFRKVEMLIEQFEIEEKKKSEVGWRNIKVVEK